MHKVLILMSTYNGREKICNQVKSIMGQKKVESYIYIRDDGSDEETIDILKHRLPVQKKTGGSEVISAVLS